MSSIMKTTCKKNHNTTNKKELRMKRLIAILLILIFSVAMLTACGDDAGLTGKYYLTSVTEGDETMDASTLAELGLDISGFHIEFLDSNRFRIVTFDESEDGTYKLDGKSLTLSADGETIDATIDNSTITLDAEGTIMVFEKS